MKTIVDWAINHLSEIIAGIALVFSIFTQIKQGKSEKKLNDLKKEFYETQSEYNKIILEKEQTVSVKVFTRELKGSAGSKELVFENISTVHADNFNVDFKNEFRSICFNVPKFPTTLFNGESISVKYNPIGTGLSVADIVISWENIKTGKVQSEARMINL